MDSVGNFLNEDCNSLSKMFSSDEEIDFALQFLKGFGTDPSNFWPIGEANANANLAIFDENFNPNFYFSQESTNYSSSSNYSSCFPTPSHENYHFCDSNLIPMMNDISESVNFCIMDGEINALAQVFPNDQVMQDVISLNEQMGNDTVVNADNTDLGVKRKFEDSQQPGTVKDLKTKSQSVEHPKKKSHVIRDTPKNKRNTQPKKNPKLIQNVNNDEESNYSSPNGQSSSSCSSEDDSNTSQELNAGSAALNSSGKARAGRGAATDPQSLYARKRRERINERLRILQNLVPNGTKVDISTMLEEAVHYVKFLQLQIKLLSSDDMWMYAPIAYNGMDMGLYQKISPTL